MLTDDYEILDDTKGNNQIIKLTSDPYSGIMYHYGKVEFITEGEQLRLKFEHDVVYNLQDVDTSTNDFKHRIGDILVDLLEEGLLKKNIVYTGGQDEN